MYLKWVKPIVLNVLLKNISTAHGVQSLQKLIYAIVIFSVCNLFVWLTSKHFMSTFLK